MNGKCVDNKSFEFNLESNGRLPNPMKYEIKDVKNGGYNLFSIWDSNQALIRLGDIILFKEDMKSQSKCCVQTNGYIDYHGIEYPLCNKTNGNQFTPKRIIVIQMK